MFRAKINQNCNILKTRERKRDPGGHSKVLNLIFFFFFFFTISKLCGQVFKMAVNKSAPELPVAFISLNKVEKIPCAKSTFLRFPAHGCEKYHVRKAAGEMKTTWFAHLVWLNRGKRRQTLTSPSKETNANEIRFLVDKTSVPSVHTPTCQTSGHTQNTLCMYQHT